MASSTSASALSSSSFDAYNNTLQASALKAVRTAVTSLPADVDFHRTVDGDYAADLDACAERVLALTNQLLGLASTADASRSSRNKGKGRMLEDQDDVVDRFHSVVVDSMDQMLERAVRDAYCRLSVGTQREILSRTLRSTHS
jgi:exosome complex exonuclease RRP6